MLAIKNMEMPKSCLDCPISHVDEIDYYICGEIGKNVYLYANEIHPDCPLVEIVTCKECKHYKEIPLNSSDEIIATCKKNKDRNYHFLRPNFYCADAERRE